MPCSSWSSCLRALQLHGGAPRSFLRVLLGTTVVVVAGEESEALSLEFLFPLAAFTLKLEAIASSPSVASPGGDEDEQLD